MTDQKAATVFEAQAALPSGWSIMVKGTYLRVNKPDGSYSQWNERPKTNGSGMYDLCMALSAAGQAEGQEPFAEVVPFDDKHPIGIHWLKLSHPPAIGTKLYAQPQTVTGAEDALDAKRYRWLRAQEPCNFSGPGWQIRHHWYAREAVEGGYKNGLFTVCLNGRSLDDEIDAAITTGAPK